MLKVLLKTKRLLEPVTLWEACLTICSSFFLKFLAPKLMQFQLLYFVYCQSLWVSWEKNWWWWVIQVCSEISSHN